MTFDNAQHPRATDGKFAEKLGAAAEVSLDTLDTDSFHAELEAELYPAPEPDRWEKAKHLNKDVMLRVAAATPGTVGSNPGHWYDQQELLDALHIANTRASVINGDVTNSVKNQPPHYLDWYFGERANRLQELADRKGDNGREFGHAALTYRRLQGIAAGQAADIDAGLTRIAGSPQMRERHLDAASVTGAADALRLILSKTPAAFSKDETHYVRGTKTGQVYSVESTASGAGVQINYVGGESDRMYRKSAHALYGRLILHEMYNEDNVGEPDPRSRL